MSTLIVKYKDGEKIIYDVLFYCHSDKYNKDYAIFRNPDNEQEIHIASYTKGFLGKLILTAIEFNNKEWFHIEKFIQYFEEKRFDLIDFR